MRENLVKQKKSNGIPELLMEQLAGKRIVLGGCNGKLRDDFVQKLAQMIEKSGADVILCSKVEKTQAEDYVLLFGGFFDAAENQKKNAGNAGGFGYPELLSLGEELQILAQKKPKSIVFLSDYAVYGKCFGGSRIRKEDELGYVSHTAVNEAFVQNMRMAEHLICRLAREDGIEAKAVRAGAGRYDEEEDTVIQAVLQVLLGGKRGEIYNLPGKTGAVEQSLQSSMKIVPDPMEHSPLSPIEIVPDTAKYAGMSKSE